MSGTILKVTITVLCVQPKGCLDYS